MSYRHKMAVDAATRSILAGVIAPTAKAVDAAAVLARMLVPEPMRPGLAGIAAAFPLGDPARAAAEHR